MGTMMLVCMLTVNVGAVHAVDSSIVSRMEDLKSKNDELIDYVDGLDKYYGMEFDIDLTEESQMDDVPLLIQWDKRWGYKAYGSGLIGYTGCGPTCLSMVILYLTDQAEYTPAYLADYAMNNGYYVWGAGTGWDFFEKGARNFGLTSENLPYDEATMKKHLDAGEVLICSMRPGDFTQGGHFIVLKGYNEKGFLLNDPNSKVRSRKTWDPEVFVPQVKQMWGFKKAE